MGHLWWKSDKFYYLFTSELSVSTKAKAVISHLINPPLWSAGSVVAEACLCFCVPEPSRDLAGEPPRAGVCFVAGRGCEHGFVWIQVCLCLIPLCKLCCGSLQPWSSVHWFITNHPRASLSSILIYLFFLPTKQLYNLKSHQYKEITGLETCSAASQR